MIEEKILTTKNLSVHYSEKYAIKEINIAFSKNKVTAIMGPSGCGKTTLLRCFNRLHELSPNVSTKGKVLLNDEDILKLDPILVRRKVGMVFQRPNPFPTMNIHKNVIAGYKLNGIKMKKSQLDDIVEESLVKAGLWEEVKGDLYKKGTFLSGGQQQRLCIARALAMKPDILLLDEPTSALDPIATSVIERLIVELKETVTIIIVTHNIAQAGRVSDYTAFLYLGELIEFGLTNKVFSTPENEQTERFLTGKFG
jgi:phosphate transport system ATP-binding protein